MAHQTTGRSRPATSARPKRIAHLLARLVLAAFLGVIAASIVRGTPAHAVQPHALYVSYQPTGTRCTKALAQGPNGITTVDAEGARAIVLCAYIEDVATGTPQMGLPVEFRVTVGTVGFSGTSRYSGPVFSTDAGISQISYRGDGKSFGTDTVIVRYEAGNAIATTTIEVAPAAGRTGSRIVVTDPPSRIVAPSGTSTEARYVSPMTGVPIALQVQDWMERGVNNQVLIIRTDRGTLAANPGFAQSTATLCATARSRALVLTSAATNLLRPTGPPMPGTIDLVVCADPEAEPGAILVTAESITGALSPVTIALRQAGRPAAVTVEAREHTVTATVSDAVGNPLADGTPVRFILPPVLGSLSAGCVLTRDGAASVAVSSVEEAVVLVVVDYHVTGSVASTCAAPGTEQLTTSVRVLATSSAAEATPAASGGDAGVEARTSDRSAP